MLEAERVGCRHDSGRCRAVPSGGTTPVDLDFIDDEQQAAADVHGILDTEREQVFDDLAALAAALTGAPFAAVTFRDGRRHWCKARVGDLASEWYDDGPGVAAVGVAPVSTPEGVEIGAVAVYDGAPRDLTPAQREGLVRLARQVAALVELRRDRPVSPLREDEAAGVAVVEADGVLRSATPALERLLGWSAADLIGTNVFDLLHPDDADNAVESFVTTAAFPGEKVPIDLRVARADGSWCPVEVVAQNRLDDASVAGIELHVRSIEERPSPAALVAGEARVLGMIARGAPVEATLGALADLIEEHAQGASCCITLADGDGRLRVVAAPAVPPTVRALVDGLEVGPRALSCGTAAYRRQAVVVADVAADPLWDGASDAALGAGVRAAWSMPVLAFADRRALGTIGTYHPRPGRPRRSYVRFVDLCTNLAAMAVERGHAEARLAHQATHDALTGLPNRTLFLDRLGQALAQRHEDGTTVAVVFLDVDRFKVINDSAGHGAGDRLLTGLAQRLSGLVRPGDTVARFGGDEFTVLCQGVAGASGALKIAERIVEGTAAPFALDDGEVVVTLSAGIALPRAGDTPETLLRDADAAMYRAKERGRNRIEVFDEAMRDTAVARLDTEKALRRALDADELVLHYQPQVRVADGRLTGVEALVRWQHPERGLLPPGQFVPLAEEAGLIVPLGARVLEEACRQAQAWRRAGTPVVVWVNVSPVQVAQPDLARRVAGVLDATGVDPALIGLELTESALLADASSVVALSELGVRLAIDDFGTGYSSLDHLRRFPFDLVKIDRSFVAALDGARGTAIVAAVVGLAHALGLEALAEGVETEAQHDALRGIGCDLAQGFWFARPEPAATVAHLP